MKTLITFVFVLATALTSFGQSGELASVDVEESLTTTKIDKLASSRSLRKNQKAIAISQLKQHLAENLEYKSILSDNRIESDLMLDVQINRNGHIVSSSITSSSNTYFDKIVLKTIGTMKSLELTTEKYYGPRNISVPIRFSID